jgi:hypothetical protein
MDESDDPHKHKCKPRFLREEEDRPARSGASRADPDLYFFLICKRGFRRLSCYAAPSKRMHGEGGSHVDPKYI